MADENKIRVCMSDCFLCSRDREECPDMLHKILNIKTKIDLKENDRCDGCWIYEHYIHLKGDPCIIFHEYPKDGIRLRECIEAEEK